MLISVVLSILFIITTYVYVRWRQLKQYWAKRQVSHLPPHPVYGSLTFLLRENPGPFYRRMYENFKVPYVGIWVFWRPGILVNSVDIARNILIRDQANFRNRFASAGTSDTVGWLNLFTLKDPLCTVIKRRLSVLFTGSKLRGVQNIITRKSKELVERIDKERQKPNPSNLPDVITDFSTDIIGISVFGVESEATLTGESQIRTVTKDFTQFSLLRALSWCCAFFIPELIDVFRFKMFPTQTIEYLRNILQMMIAERGGLENKVTEPKDLLDILIKIKQECGEELDMSENMMLAQAATLLQSGYGTTGLTMSLAIYELAFSPEIQDKLYKELKLAKDKHDGSLLEASILSQLTYLNCVINESLRKYPILPVLDRVALRDYKIDDHVTIKAGTPVFVNLVGIHYDSDIFHDPDKFIPDRFLAEDERGLQLSRLMPFGEGPRMCLGQRIGLSIVRHGLTAIVLNYEIKALPNAVKPSQVTLDKRTVFTVPEDWLSVEFVPRN